jgi:hypothetical protein
MVTPTVSASPHPPPLNNTVGTAPSNTREQPPKNWIIGLEFNLQLLLLLESIIIIFNLQEQVDISPEEGLSLSG